MLSLMSISSNKIVASIATNIINKMCTKLYLWRIHFISRTIVIREVEHDITSLNLPHTLKEKLKQFVTPIYDEVHEFHCYMFMCNVSLHLNYVPKLSFTMEGKIDYILSARKIVLDKHLDLKSRIILACRFCFEEEVLAFWKNQPGVFLELAKDEKLMTLNNWLKYLEETETPLEHFLWKDCSLLSHALFSAVREFNLEAAEYFFRKMTAMPNCEKIRSLAIANRGLAGAYYFPSGATSFLTNRIETFLLKSQLESLRM